MAKKYQRSLRDEKRVAKYKYVLAATGSVELARQARSWSVDRIGKTYGVKVSYHDDVLKRLEKTLPKTERARKMRYNAFINKGVKTRLVTVRGRTYPIPTVKPKKSIKKRRTTVVDTYIPPVSDDVVEKPKKAKRKTPAQLELERLSDVDLLGIDRFEIVKDKLSNWQSWSANKDFPPMVHEVVERANRIHNRTLDDGYGFAVAFTMYTENLSFEDAVQVLKPETFVVDGYTDTRRI